MSDDVIEITEDNYESEVGGSQTPYLLDFSAEWCGPCKKMAPIIEELASQYQGRLRVGHVDIEASPVTAARFGVMSVPTFIFLKEGKQANQFIGAVPRQTLDEAIHKVID